MGTLLQLLIRSLETGGIYALATLGIIIIFRTNYIVNFAQGTMSMFNAFVVTWLCGSMGLPLWLATLGGMLSSVLTGLVVDFFVIRRTKKVAGTGKEIISLGLLMIFLGIVPLCFGVDPLSLPKFIPNGGLSFSGANLSYNGLLNICLGLFIMLLLFYMLQKSKLGLAIRTTASNEKTARLMGVPSKRVTMFSWILATMLGCLAGVMIAPTTSVTVNLMDSVQINALFACVLGGFQTFYGPVIGAYLIGIGKNLLVFYASSVWGEQLLYGLILAFLMIRPNGLVGKKYYKKV